MSSQHIQYYNTNRFTAPYTPIMDEISHTARGGYSLRQLYVAATYCVQLINPAGTVTENIGFVNFGPDETAIDTFISTHTTARVNIFYDQSPHGRNLTISNTIATRPEVVWDSGKGKHRIYYGGGNYIKSGTETLIAQPYQCYVIAALTDGTNVQRNILESAVGTAGRRLIFWRGLSGVLSLFQDITISSAGSYATFPSSQFTTTQNSTNSSIRKDGSSIVSGNIGTGGLDGLVIGESNFGTGSSRPWFGYIDEAIIVDSLGTTDRNTLEASQSAYK